MSRTVDVTQKSVLDFHLQENSGKGKIYRHYHISTMLSCYGWPRGATFHIISDLLNLEFCSSLRGLGSKNQLFSRITRISEKDKPRLKLHLYWVALPLGVKRVGIWSGSGKFSESRNWSARRLFVFWGTLESLSIGAVLVAESPDSSAIGR